jgi:site-specific recombinase XerD
MFNGLRDGMAVRTARSQGLQNQQIKRALKKIHTTAGLSSRVSTYSITEKPPN